MTKRLVFIFGLSKMQKYKEQLDMRYNRKLDGGRGMSTAGSTDGRSNRAAGRGGKQWLSPKSPRRPKMSGGFITAAQAVSVEGVARAPVEETTAGGSSAAATMSVFSNSLGHEASLATSATLSSAP